jgi:hypothetical protein
VLKFVILLCTQLAALMVSSVFTSAVAAEDGVQSSDSEWRVLGGNSDA